MGMKKKRNQEISLKNRKRSSDTFRQHTLIVHSCSGWIFFGFLKKFLDFFCFFHFLLIIKIWLEGGNIGSAMLGPLFQKSLSSFFKKKLVRMYLDFLKITTSDFFLFFVFHYFFLSFFSK